MQHQFAEMASRELEEALSRMPPDSTHKFLVFAETVRVLDYWSIFQFALPEENRLTPHDFDLIQWGWNLAAEHLFTAVDTPGAFPIMKSTNEIRLFATSILHKLGQSVLLYRASEMIRYGILDVKCEKDVLTVRMTEDATGQFLDIIETDRLNEMERILGDSNISFSKGWQLFDTDDLSKVVDEPGSFFGQSNNDPLERYKLDNIDEIMAPLVHPWDSGHGIMMGYGALPEVDDYFFAEATELTREWRAEAGIHPSAKLGKINGSDLSLIIILLTSLNLKHIRFARLAMSDYPEISIPQSLTIWCPLEDLVETIVDYTGLNKDLVRSALDAVTMRPNEASRLNRHTSRFIPLLISLGNGLVLRPVSSILRNPFLSALTLQEWRDPTAKDRISKPREDWMRSEVYALFQGLRYKRVEGNIKIRKGNKVVTDIDGAVLDIMTGELALFQLKWQDYFTNDVRKLRSKAANLTKELDEWADKVKSWTEQHGKNALVKALRLKLPKGTSVSSIYLFGISRNAARMRGYGFTTRNKDIAIANWPQFLRTRYEIGPVERVFHQLFDTLRLRMNETVTTQALPLTIKVSGKSICFENLWSGFGDENSEL